ncbi:MAG: hypothetical protein D6689_19800 [Deltaproteobacteria bacterium]|nr:MAG: hypothetical protein D6689_19800 [Deltaproteobacteria bacterium]
MAVKKIAISVPEDVLAQVDRAAAQLGVPRSRFISDVLRRVASARSDAEIRRRVNAVFADPEVAREQRDTARAASRAVRASEAEW